MPILSAKLTAGSVSGLVWISTVCFGFAEIESEGLIIGCGSNRAFSVTAIRNLNHISFQSIQPDGAN